MKKLIFLLITIFSFYMLDAQNDSVEVFPARQKTFDFQFETGTVFSSFRGLGSTGLYFFSPGVKINATPKLNFKIQTIISQPMYSNIGYSDSEVKQNYVPNRNLSFLAEGEYKFTEKLFITGSVFNNPNGINLSPYNTGLYNDIYNRIENAFSVGMYYQFSKNLQIGAEFRQVQYARPMFLY